MLAAIEIGWQVQPHQSFYNMAKRVGKVGTSDSISKQFVLNNMAIGNGGQVHLHDEDCKAWP